MGGFSGVRNTPVHSERLGSVKGIQFLVFFTSIAVSENVAFMALARREREGP